jgi:hypothetical protein
LRALSRYVCTDACSFQVHGVGSAGLSEAWGLAGRCLDEKSLRQRIFYSGMEHALRPEAWKFLLGVLSFSDTHADRSRKLERLRRRYCTLKRQWTSITPGQAAMCASPSSIPPLRPLSNTP